MGQPLAFSDHVYVWEYPVRLTHWVTVAAICVLSFTGFYIGWPWFSGPPLLMTWMRAVHRITAFVLMASLLLRLYWGFAGNTWASWRVLFPWATRRGRRGMGRVLGYYLFIRGRPDRYVGHNELAGMTYSLVVLLMVLEVATGGALVAQAKGGWWSTLFGWVFLLMSQQGVRLLHHLGMWLLLGFAVHHVYSAAVMDFEERNGMLSSIVTGYKFFRREA